jgi:hypothetical protein
MGIAVVAMILGFTLIVVKMGLDYSKARLESLPDAPADSSILVSELEEMISTTVADAIVPLKQRIKHLEVLHLPPVETTSALPPARDDQGRASSNDGESAS